MTTYPKVGSALIMVLASMATGCFGGSSVELHETTGTVTKDGVPLVKARLEFLPQNGNGASSQGMTDEQGNFKLYYSTGQLGAVPGPHKVTIQDGYKAGEKDPYAASQADPTKAPPPPKDRGEEEIIVTVDPSGDNHVEIEL